MKQGICIEEANRIMLDSVHAITATETVSLMDSLGRILASDAVATIDQPPFPRSPVDGYACRSQDITEASVSNPITLAVIAEVCAGNAYCEGVGKGQAVRIMTGAPIPTDCDCCIRQEDTDYGEQKVMIMKGSEPYGDYCHQGEDFKKGTILIPKKTKITYIELGILASMGVSKVSVYRKPNIAVLTSGDELVLPGESLSIGKIYNSNQFLILGRLQELGITPYLVQHMKDDIQGVSNTLLSVMQEVDMIITTGGVSVGKKDIFHEVLTNIGADKKFWKVQVKPGGPTIFSMLQGKPIVSLSGNPFGALVNFELLIRPMLYKMTEDARCILRNSTAILKTNFEKYSKGRRVLRAYYQDGEVTLPNKHASGILSSASGCNCLVDIPAGSKALKKGDVVSIWKE